MRTGSYPADINRLSSHTEKSIKLLTYLRETGFHVCATLITACAGGEQSLGQAKSRYELNKEGNIIIYTSKVLKSNGRTNEHEHFWSVKSRI